MEIYSQSSGFNLKNTVITLGKFNGLHRGHQKLINYLLREKNLFTVVFSFDTGILSKNKLLTTNSDRILLCRQFGIDNLILYPVNEYTKSMSPQDFIEKILVKELDVKVIVTGNDFRFGKNRLGDINMLREYGKKYGYHVIVAESEMYKNIKISSTRIKEEMSKGNLVDANNMLGYKYFVCGKVIMGKQLGRTIDVSTLNVEYEEDKLILPCGVYATDTVIDNVLYKSITNIGLCPTVEKLNKISIESHVFDFNKEIYGEYVKVQFKSYIREEKKFDSLAELKTQIEMDKRIAKEIN